MNINLFSRFLLALHLCGMTMMAGTTIVDYFTFKTFCKLTNSNSLQAQGLLPIMSRYAELVRAGALVIILTGLTVLYLDKGAFWQQWWFKIKIGLVLLLLLNGIFIGNRLGLTFRRMVFAGSEWRPVAIQLNRFYLAQLTIFVLIILLSIIRPGTISR